MATPNKQEDKLKKKLKNFFDKNASLTKRWKSLMSYVEKASQDDLNKFFNENFYMIYGVFLDSFQAYENTCKKGKHSNSEMLDLMTVLRNVLIHLSELIRKKWQTRSIASVLEKVLCKENKINIRLIGFELMLIFLEAVQVLEPSQIDLFAQSIDLSPFCVDDNSGAKLRRTALSAPDKGSVLVLSSSAGTMENSVKLWEYMLDYMSQHESTFEFWFDLLKKEYLSIYFPEVSKKMNITSDADFGFKAHCPHQLMEVTMTRLESWMKDENLVAILWSSEENIQLILEIFRQSCMMPISYAQTIKTSIGIFRSLFLSAKPPAQVDSRRVEFRKFFFKQLSSVFFIHEQEKTEEHKQLCLEIIAMYKNIFIELYPSFEKETQECLLHTLLGATTDMCKQYNSSSMAQTLVPTLLDTIFFMWIHTKRNTEAMWTALQEGISSLFHLLVAIKQTREKLIQLTLVIRTLLYPARKIKKNVKPRGDENASTEPKKVLRSMCPDTRPDLPVIPVDPNIGGIEWELSDVIYVWTQVLNIFNNVNAISDSSNHAAAIEVLTEVIDILQRAEEGIPHSNSHYSNPKQPKPLCLIDIFGPWLFEACSLPESHMNGKAAAIGSLCRLVVRHHGDRLPLSLLSHFYAILFQCLKNHPNSLVSWAILQNSNNIFSMALPGCNALMPHYVAELKRVLRANSTPKEVKLKSILIIGSLVCYPHHLDGLTAPLDLLVPQGASYNISVQLKKDISHILIETANSDPDPEHKVLCIWAMCVVVFEELLHKPNKGLIKEITKTVLPFCTHQNAQVYRAALDSLSCLTLKYDEFRQLDESLIHVIVEFLSGNILRELTEGKKTGQLRENLVADHFYCILDWIMSSTTNLFNKRSLTTKVFDAIEIGLLGQKVQIDPNAQVQVAPSPVELTKKSEKKFKRTSGMPTQSQQSGSSSPREKLADLLEGLKLRPSHGSEVVKEAAQILLIQLCNFLQNFPSKHGVEIMCSQITENDDVQVEPPPLFCIYNDFALFSLVEVPLEDGTTIARLILRDSTGKYAWDTVINYNNYTHEIPPAYSLLCKPIHEPPVPEVPVISMSDRKQGVAPSCSLEEGAAVDQLDDLLQFLGEAFPDCLPDTGNQLNQPTPAPQKYAANIQTAEKALLAQQVEDQNTVDYLKKNRAPYQSWAVIPPEQPTPISNIHHCRMLLSHFGFAGYAQSSFSLVENSQRFQRSVALLDKNSGREMLKIGVIYVKEGQDDQKIILKNDTKSDLYAEFVRGLGWPIDVASHRGYLGGLDPKLTTGVSTPYYANIIMEVVFHEITSMPTKPLDAQQIQKKRHVGNDIVHIVYSEHSSDYLPTTITSQFNDAHIIIYPLPNGLYRLQIYRKENVQLFGPLLHGMCVNKELLPVLVRQTAINANRYVRYNTGGYSRPFPTRRRALDEIVERFKIQRPYEDLISELIPQNKPESQSASPSKQ